ncbi:cystatin domain-containing protein [Limnohabitans sp. Rim8]|uniref:cystatin domain-containing protein n=1 Tax=Limnohabitans sp. Rim8 TaxID=1100718 RepID=UPI00260DD814|nr:cystatin domain-containing protein [Limnohabitans sp. Rim8]
MNSSSRWAERLRMSVWLKVFSWLAGSLILASFSACSPDQPEAMPANQALAGAWVPADSFSPAVQEAARFAVQTFAVQNKARVLYKDVTQARQKVVAGLNFELLILVTWEATPRTAQAKVWRQLDGTYRLQSWDWQD